MTNNSVPPPSYNETIRSDLHRKSSYGTAPQTCEELHNGKAYYTRIAWPLRAGSMF